MFFKKSKINSMFLVSVPKSGTIYTWNMLSRITGLKIPLFEKMKNFSKQCDGIDYDHGVYSYSDAYTTVLRPDLLKKYSYNYVVLSHMGASHNNVSILNEIGFKKVTVLLRDPKDALISWYYHCEKHHNYKYYSKMYYHPKEYYDWDKKKKINHLIRSYYPIIINIIKSWLNEYFQNTNNINLMFFDELKTNPEIYFNKIIKFHNLQIINDVDLSPIKNKFHFRKGENKEWMKELSSEQIELCNSITGKDFTEQFNKIIKKKLGKNFQFRKKNISKIYNLLNIYPNSNLLYDYLIKIESNTNNNKIKKLRSFVNKLNFDDGGNFYLEKERIRQVKELITD